MELTEELIANVNCGGGSNWVLFSSDEVLIQQPH